MTMDVRLAQAENGPCLVVQGLKGWGASPSGTGGVLMLPGDMGCLDPGMSFNDACVDFGLGYACLHCIKHVLLPAAFPGRVFSRSAA